MAIEIFFGTNRKVKKRNQDQQAVDFGSDMSEIKPLLHFGKAKISDNGQDIESVNISKSVSFDPICCSQDTFDEIEDRVYKGLDTILYFHGFNNTFNESLIEAAKLKSLYERETGKEYTMVVFSWPSQGSIFSYGVGRKQAQASKEVFASGIYELSRFLIKLCWFSSNLKSVVDIGKKKNQSRLKKRKRDCGRFFLDRGEVAGLKLRIAL